MKKKDSRVARHIHEDLKVLDLLVMQYRGNLFSSKRTWEHYLSLYVLLTLKNLQLGFKSHGKIVYWIKRPAYKEHRIIICTFMHNGRPSLPLFILNNTNELFQRLMNLKDCIIGINVHIYIYIQLNNGMVFFFFCVQ